MSGASILKSWIFERRLNDDFARIWGVLKNHPEAVVLALGALLRVLVYGDGRTFWMDEWSLWGNLAGKRAFDFSETLSGDQLAPFAFMIAERALMSLLGVSRYVARLLPLVSGLLALAMFGRLARAILPRRAALIALALFAFSDDLIYYSSELKPYSTDLAIGLAISLTALDAVGKPASVARVAALAILAVVSPWCSFASTFVVAGCGGALIVASLMSGRPRGAALWSVIGIGWLASLLVSYRASSALLSPYTTMYLFWDFAFLPLWPLPISTARLAATLGILLEVFVTPLNLVAPLWPWAGVILPVAVLTLGVGSLARRSWPAWAIMVLPIALAMVASAMKRYPFHGRLILELVPAFFILIAAGTDTLLDSRSGRTRLGSTLILILLFAYPILVAVKNSASVPYRVFNRHGDLRTNLFMSSSVRRESLDGRGDGLRAGRLSTRERRIGKMTG
jgi:hypothetical protein